MKSSLLVVLATSCLAYSAPTYTNVSISVTTRPTWIKLPPVSPKLTTFQGNVDGLAASVFTDVVTGTSNTAATFCELEVFIVSRANTLQFLLHSATYAINYADATILTKYSAYVTTATPLPADLDPHYVALNSLYFEIASQAGFDCLFYDSAEAYDPSIQEFSWERRGTLTSGEAVTILISTDNAYGYTGLVYLMTAVIPDAGHCWQLQYATQTALHNTHQWMAYHGF